MEENQRLNSAPKVLSDRDLTTTQLHNNFLLNHCSLPLSTGVLSDV